MKKKPSETPQTPQEPSKPTDTPKTGDDSNIRLWLLLAGLALCGTGGSLFLLKRKNKKKYWVFPKCWSFWKHPVFFVDGRKRCMEMIGIIIGGAAVVIAVSLYCCIRVGAEEDRRLEELDRRAKQDAEESG